MNRIYRSYLVLCCIAAMFATSCTKTYNKNAVIQTTTDQTKLNSLFAALRPAPQNMVVTAGFLQTVYGVDGTKLTFYPNSFKDANGNTITKGIINIQLTEIYTFGDMISCRASTTSGSQLLTSGGEILITATMNGAEVFANKYGIGFRQHTLSTQPMSLFYGNADEADSVVTWLAPGSPQPGVYAANTVSLSDTSVVVVITPTGNDTITTHSAVFQYYQFDSCANFNWINCDYFYTSTAPLTDVSVIMPDTSFNQSNSEVFILFPSINSAAHMSQYNVSTHTFDLPKGYYVPIGMPIDIVVATNKDGVYYYFQQTGLTTFNDMFIFANMSQSSLSYITTQLQGL